MRMTRVHVDAALAVGAQVALPDAAAQHLVRVLRLQAGDSCVLFNGDGCDYDARLAHVDRRGARADITGQRVLANESPLPLMLLQGIARGDRMDLVLQKATELGVSAIVPVQAERSEVRLDAARLAKRLAHWRSVVVAACEQSGRARVPDLSTPCSVAKAAAAAPGDALRLTLDPFATSVLSALPTPGAGGVVVAIGPEGGWSPRDREFLAAAGFEGLRLGPRVLRTETAGLAALAALQSRFGDL